MISCICVTCARVRFLEHALADFLAQDYTGPKQLVILNTCPDQQLHFDHPDVKIYNLDQRPKSLGEARNSAIALSAGTKIVIHDDDDSYLPHHLSTIAKAFAEQRPDRTPPMDPRKMGCEWIWLNRQFWGWGDTIKEITQGQCPCFAFTRSAWESVGGYTNLSVGEDRDLISKITQKFPGNRYQVEGMPSFIYRWSQGVYHISGLGDDVKGRQTAHDRFWADALVRLNSGNEPHGEIVLKPNQPVKWMELATECMERESKKNSMNDICLVELGRYGDIINMLPIAHHISKTQIKPFVMVSQEFAKIFDGISYATPYPVNLSFHELDTALKLAREKFRTVIQCQIYGGSRYRPEVKTSNFNKESWRYAGFLHEFYNPEWRVVFDQRDSSREGSITRKLFRTNFPKVVTNLTRGVSAPLPLGVPILAKLKSVLHQRFEVVDIGTLKLPYFYDLLGVLDKAALFVTIDTATLHLAAATTVPMVAMVRDEWVGAEPRYGCIKKFTYSEVNNDWNAVVKTVQEYLCK